ncbi:MAG: DUF2752 domain-containing protein [Flavobacterium sp.]|nr:DUF2752 domain-containing protein [Flavobacterium sp.]
MTSTNYTNNTKRKRKIYGIAGAVITLVVPFFLMLFNHDNHLETAQSLCPFKMLTGFPCPGCGITKSMVYFYEGDLYKSLCYHVLGPFVIVFCAISVVVLTMELKTGKEYFNTVLYNRKAALVMACLLIAYHMVRLVYFIQHNNADDIFKQSIWK